jgi:hypothetical protein
MRKLSILSWVVAVAVFAPVNRAEAQLIYGGSLRYSYGVGYAASTYGGSAVSVRGPFGGSVTSVQGPFGGGAIGVRGPFGGAAVVRTSAFGVPPADPLDPFGASVSMTVVKQTVLNPAPAPLPYSPGYLARIPPGYLTLATGGVNYYYTPELPPGSQPTTVRGDTYYVCDGVSYQPYFLGTRVVYLVVEL